MTARQRHAIMNALKLEYAETHGPRETWSRETLGKYHEELGIMVNCVGILRDAGLLLDCEPRFTETQNAPAGVTAAGLECMGGLGPVYFQNMKTIIEITPDSKTSYAMPGEVYDAVVRALSIRMTKGVKRALALLPKEMREAVTTTALPKEQGGLRGLTANVMIVDEVFELTDAEAAAIEMPNNEGSREAR